MTAIAQPVPIEASRGRVRVSALVEFLLVGGATPLLFAISWLLQRTIGLSSADLAVGFLFFYGAHVINDPHFSVTYLLFYEDARARAFGRAFAPSSGRATSSRACWSRRGSSRGRPPRSRRARRTRSASSSRRCSCWSGGTTSSRGSA